MQVLTEQDLFPTELYIATTLQTVLGERPAADEIHQARVLIKALRARLHLYEGCLGQVPGLDEALRRFNKSLSLRRDYAVAVQTLSELAQGHEGKKLQAVVDELCAYFSRHGEQEGISRATLEAQVNEILTGIHGIAGFELSQARVTAYLQDQVLSCCDTGDAALQERRCKALHSWRKKVKMLLYQLQIFRATEGKLARLGERLDKLGKSLGRVHDSCFLQSLVEQIQAGGELQNDPAPLLKLLDKKRARQIKKSMKQHRKICLSRMVRLK